MWDGDKLTIYEESQAVFNMRTCSRKCSVCLKRTCASSRSSSARVSAANFGRGHIVHWQWPRRGSWQAGQAVLSRKMTFQSAGIAPALSTRPARRDTGRQARLARTRLRLSPLDLDEYHENCGEATAFHTAAKPAGAFRMGPAQHRHAIRYARPRRGARPIRD